MIKSWFSRLRGNVLKHLPLAPTIPFYAIGDTHGRFDLLTRLLDRLDPAHPVIFFGDYIDRVRLASKCCGICRRSPTTSA